MNLIEFKELSVTDIDSWYQEQERLCSGCEEGKMKEHARNQSSKPIQSNNPGGVTVGDMMFIQGSKNFKNLS